MILRNEVAAALESLKQKKAPGSDQLTAEVLNAMDDFGVATLHRICSHIWLNGDWPQDSIILPVHKKGSTKNCSNYRTLLLMQACKQNHAPHSQQSHSLLPTLAYLARASSFYEREGHSRANSDIRQIVEKA